MAGITVSQNSRQTFNGLRPVNLQTDLAGLADLIETAFAGTIDSGGRAAIREMRQLSRLGPGLSVLSNINDLAQGMSLGYVWVADGRIIGNVSVYPTNRPADLGKAWIIANVAVYPEYRGQGIATQLMQASMNMIRERSGGTAVLQVDLDNDSARHVYRKLGFREERAWTQWSRSIHHTVPYIETDPSLYISHRRPSDWTAEYDLARAVRPQNQGGVDWLKPTHPSTFRRSILQRLQNWLSLRSVERLVIRDADRLLASLWIETVFGINRRQLTLMTYPESQQATSSTLLMNAMRRFGQFGLTMNHPHDDLETSDLLRQLQFREYRTVMHMCWTS